MSRLLLLFLFSLGHGCLIKTAKQHEGPYPTLSPPPLCLYHTAPIAKSNLTFAHADDLCVAAAAGRGCLDVKPMVSFESQNFRDLYSSNLLVRSCSKWTIITPSFRYTMLQNTLQAAAVLNSPYWTFSSQLGVFHPHGIGDATIPYFFTNKTLDDDCALPIVCICILKK